MVVSFKARRHALMAIAGLVVAYVRTGLQYKRYGWDSFTGFAASWFVHYIALALLVGASAIVIQRVEGFFFGDNKTRSRVDVDDLLVYVPIVALVAAVAIFVLAHWVPIGDFDE